MLQVLTILLLTLLQFLAGFGILCLLKISMRPVLTICTAVLLGLALFSVVPFLLQLFYIPITRTSIFVTLNCFCFLLNLRSKQGFKKLMSGVQNASFRIKWYELPSLLLISFFVIISVWRCYYYPPTPRDLTSGPEVIAEYTVKEKTMINSVFTVDLSTTNNQYKPPFITSLQIIYKYAGFPFGQVWLSVLFVFFLLFLYRVLRLRLHPLIAGLLLVMFIVIPEMYAYSFMALFDYPNAIYFCVALFFLFEFFRNKVQNYLWLAALLMGLATYIRSETLVLAALLTPAIFVHYSSQKNYRKSLIQAAIFNFPSLLAYLLSITVYINFYLPEGYAVSGLLNKELWNPAGFFARFMEMNDQVIFSKNGLSYFGYFPYFFIAVLLLDSIWKEPWENSSLNWLYGILVVFIGLPLLGHIFPLFDLDHSTKRGLFKIFPPMLLFMANSRVLITLSQRIEQWERKSGKQKQSEVKLTKD